MGFACDHVSKKKKTMIFLIMHMVLLTVKF